MSVTIGFDVYGTLINPHGVITELGTFCGDEASAFSRLWREKQLEYSFRRALMQNYEPFSVCTRQALDYADEVFQTRLRPDDKDALMATYAALPAFEDAKDGLEQAQEAGFRLFAFSNGSADALESLLSHAGLRDYFMGVVSVDGMKSFKPNPGVYSYFLRQAGATGAEAWLVSSNPFDVIGAMSSGMRAAWVQRSPDAIFDPWGITPTITINSLRALADAIGTTQP